MTIAELPLASEIDEIMPGVIADRRHLHQHPELGFQEVETAAFIVDRLTSLGLEDIRTGVGKTGVTALIRGTAPPGSAQRVVMLRADMDALPINEANDVDYCSQNTGVMHACGHDSHVSMLLGTARMLLQHRDLFTGIVKVLFQPAEEGGGGASAMIEDGALEDPNVDATFGIHIWQHTDLGTVEARPGVAMMGSDGFLVDIHAKGGHGASPHLCVDPIVVGAAIVNALQTTISREKDPVMPGVVTVGSFRAGHAANVIPDSATLRGTIRTVSAEQRDEVKTRLETLATAIAAGFGASAMVTFEYGAPPTVNDPAMTEIVKAAAAEVVGPDRIVDGPLKVVSEDYSLFLEHVPGCYYFVGSRNEEKGLVWGHHHMRFDIDEDAMAIGIETMTRTVLRYFATTS
jgi:amidohydrolase